MLLKVLYFLFIVTVLIELIKCDLKIARVHANETQYSTFDMLSDITPIRYYFNISLDPMPNFQYYNASTKIEFRSKAKSNFIAFHFKLTPLIDIHDISLLNLDKAVKLAQFNVTYFEDGDDPLIGIETSELLGQDVLYSLNIGYTARFDAGGHNGFLKFCYDVNDLRDNCFATTHFEVYNIRKAFPSFDHLTLKARFNIRVNHRSDMMAKSNMPGRIIEHNDGTMTTIFDESPPMSTYLVAIAIGKFESTSIENLNKPLMNFYTPIGCGKSTLLEMYAGRFVYALENYLEYPFPLPKLDYFASYTATDTIQGMEYWGLISFDGNAVIDTVDLVDFDRIEDTIRVIAHEIVHQYFGNLVSLKELNSMWLKEGLTTYFTSRVSAKVMPEENYVERMFLIDFGFAMQFDENEESALILNNYDMLYRNLQNSLVEVHVIYTKGSAFTNMICHVLGENSFQKFMQNLIHNFEYDSISTDDFINELQFVNDLDAKIPQDIDIAEFVSTWTNQAKFPILTVTRNYATGLVEIRQDSLLNNSFWIPFNYATKSNPNFDVTTPDGWLRNAPATNITIPNFKPDDWIMFNKQSTGYYVVNYDNRNWNLIIDLLSSDYGFELVPPLNRAKLFMDVGVLYRQGRIVDEILFKLVNLLKREHSYITWTIVGNFMYGLPDLRSYLEENVDNLVSHFYAYFGPEHRPNETRTQKIARSKAIELACKLNYKNCIQDMEIAATKLASEDFASIDNDLFMLKMIFRHGVQNGVQFKAFMRIVNRSKNKDLVTFFYENLDEKVNNTVFQNVFLATVYDLPSINNDENGLRFNLELLEMDLFYDLTIVDDCLLNNCYDFVVAFPNVTERFDRVYKMVEMVLENMEEPKYMYVGDDRRFATIYEVLDNIERRYGGDVGDRIKMNYDLNKTPLLLG